MASSVRDRGVDGNLRRKEVAKPDSTMGNIEFPSLQDKWAALDAAERSDDADVI
jgi:hypothetical protein